VTIKALKHDSLLVMILAFDKHLFCSEYGSKNDLGQIHKFVYLHSTYNLPVLNMNSKHDSRKVKK